MVRGSSVLLFSLHVGLSAPHALGQQNPGFEAAADNAVGWSVWGIERADVLDNATSYEGSRSLRLSREPPTQGNSTSFATLSQFTDVEDHGGSQVRITAAVRTNDVRGGYAGLWLRIDGSDGIVFMDNMFDRPITGTADWQRIRITADLRSDGRRISYGGLLTGLGTAWFDDFTLDVVDTASLPPPPPEVADYVNDALDVMQERSIRRDLVDWRLLRADTLQSVRGTTNVAEAHFALRTAVRRLGDRHSTFVAPVLAGRVSTAGSDAESLGPWTAPESRILEGRIGYVTVPVYVGMNADRQTRFADELQAAIAAVDSAALCGWIVDLRDDEGGNVFPMLAGIGPILGDGDASGGIFVDGTRQQSWYRDGVAGSNEYLRARVSGAAYSLQGSPDPPVAVLIGPRTASAGEAVALAFVGRRKTRLFGLPSAGRTTGNAPHYLEDGAVLNLAVTVMTDRAGRVHRGPLTPDVVVEESAPDTELPDQPAVQRASAWLRDQPECQ